MVENASNISYPGILWKLYNPCSLGTLHIVAFYLRLN